MAQLFHSYGINIKIQAMAKLAKTKVDKSKYSRRLSNKIWRTLG